MASVPSGPESPGRILAVRIEPHPDDLVLVLSGEVDLASAGLLAEASSSALAAAGLARPDRPSRLVVDLAGVSFLGIVGYHALAALRDAAERAGRPLVVRDPSPAARRLFELLPALTGQPGGHPAGDDDGDNSVGSG
jgi:anti-anti-sigma factor